MLTWHQATSGGCPHALASSLYNNPHQHDVTWKTLKEYQTIEHTPGAFANRTKTYTDHLFTKYLNDHRPRHFKWYQDTTIPDLKFLPDRLIDVQLRLLRFRAYTLSFTNRGQPTNCGHCQAVFNPIHYLVGCPAYPNARRLLLDHLSPDQHSWTDYQQAALLIRKATILPAILSKLIAKDPYRPH